MLPGATVGLTALRCTLCRGSSMVMKPARLRRMFASPSTACCSARASRFGRAMPSSEEKASWSVSTASMSSQRVMDQ